jgi:hypothetical protein
MMLKQGTRCGLILMAVICASACKSRSDSAQAKASYHRNRDGSNSQTIGPLRLGDSGRSITIVSCRTLNDYLTTTQKLNGKSAQEISSDLTASDAACEVLTRGLGDVIFYDSSSLSSFRSRLFMKVMTICEDEPELVACDDTLSDQITSMLDPGVNRGYFEPSYVKLLRRGIIELVTGKAE